MSSATKVAMEAASLSDGEAICAIYNQAISERGSTFETEMRSSADFQERIGDTRFPLLVAKLGDDVVGWAGLASYSSRPCYAGIAECSVYVDAEARGRGIGTGLTEALASAAEETGFYKLIGKLFTDNVLSIRLVENVVSPPSACIAVMASSMAFGGTCWSLSGCSDKRFCRAVGSHRIVSRQRLDLRAPSLKTSSMHLAPL